jgi:hypothetical protein
MKHIQSVFAIAAVLLIAVSQGLAELPSERNGDETTKEELAKLQGGWELILKVGNRTIQNIKTVEGNRTTVTRFDEKGAVISEHVSEFTLEITARVKVFKYWNTRPGTGERKASRSYVYAVTEDAWVEARGLLRDQAKERPALYVWRRVKEAIATNSEQPETDRPGG